MRPKTGEIVWHYQFTPNDAYDYDACWELILADIDVDGAKRKVLMQLNRNGFLYVLDRTNGKLISAKPVREGELGEPHRHGDRPAGRDRGRQEAARRRAGRALAVDPRRQELAACGVQSARPGCSTPTPCIEARMFKHLETKPFVPGQRYMFVENLPVAAQAGRADRPHRRDRSADREGQLNLVRLIGGMTERV